MDRLRTRMPYLSLNDTTHWIAARTPLTSAEPSRPAIFTERIFALGATPLYWPPDAAPLPAIRPARNVPCPYESAQLLSPEKLTHGAVVVPSASVCTCTMRPARSGMLATPVST